ncbi:hypothetical protein ABIB94_007481 [Bradyrhizobium sp. JR7.2]|uniref:DUF3551 domain-containing protein n=1 Tax=Bradyrhizobium barranii TaxID=2992140 RepID=A0ABY3R1D9_9BRAD|nr:MULTISPECIES: hypothetical protein [Bradyrhizobium]UFW91673.1 hypothetical protein BjapCC829_47840 [Bradyrhizobium japonicum]WFU00199.1 hypothetical protein QA633_48725 [Bradyrhizobium barranii]
MTEIFVIVACFTIADQADNHCKLINSGDTFRSADECNVVLQNNSRYRPDPEVAFCISGVCLG